jgi:hypothetical protein
VKRPADRLSGHTVALLAGAAFAIAWVVFVMVLIFDTRFH